MDSLSKYDYANDAVRDLAWTLFSPALCVPPSTDFEAPENDWFHARDVRDWLADLDRTPAILQDTIRRCPTRSVGHYFETLFRFFIEHGPRYELLAHNLQVHDDKRTIGSMDFIVRDQHGCVEHWEIAVKFYLGASKAARWSSWIGPNQRDRLDIKVERMRDHQLPLSKTLAGQARLQSDGIPSVDRHRGLIRGILFAPLRHPCMAPMPELIDPQGLWIPCTELDIFLRQKPLARWHRRVKPDWLAPSRVPESQTLSAKAFLQSVTLSGCDRPEMWSMLEDTPTGWRERQRVFVVSADWYASAQNIFNEF